MPKTSINGKPKKLCFSAEINEIIGAITKRSVTDKQLASYFQESYEGFAKKHDILGRTALHLAASCGRTELCQWLISAGGANINARDWESGYTPLQRALFHGHINSAVRLMQMGADSLLLDKEGLTALDLVVKDRPKQVEISPRVPCQVYIWGSNDNYTLGTGTNKDRKTPDLLDNFRKNVSIKQVCMDEYHSVFVSTCSRVWVCGNGQGGRLGVPTERHVLTPRPLGIGSEGCVMAATALNHTLILLANGTVLACGQNEYHQLGVSPYVKECLSPKPVRIKTQGEQLVGVCAGKYHSVFYGKLTLFTCGLNGGQLGHPNYESSPYIKTPTQVPLKVKSGSHITNVASSTSCVVFSLSSGDIYTLYQFQFNKLATKQLDVCQIATSGGSLQSKLVNKSNGVLKIVLLNSGGTIQIWQECNPTFKRCMFGLSGLISISFIFLNESKIFFTTKDGEAYQGTIGQIAKQTVVDSSPEEKSGFHKFLERSECYHISSHRIANIHRAVSITSDPKGKNMAVIQVHPNNALTDVPFVSSENIANQFSQLLDETTEMDNLHDVLFKVKDTFFPAHKYIVACNSSSFLTLPMTGKVIEINDIHPGIFKEILAFMYTGWCSLLNEGPITLSLSSAKDDPVRLLIDACNKYKLTSLYKKIVCFRYEDGKIILKDSSNRPVHTPCEFRRDMFPELYDVQVSSEDGKLFNAHKCILVARLDYFHNMLMGGWLETATTPVLHLECPAATLEILLDFFYSNEIPESCHSNSFENLARLLVMSDQLLCNDFKEYCEMSLVNTLNLKNASTMLHLSFLYNTTQLKQTVMQFISLNLETLLENRCLEELNDDILVELDKYHREFNSALFDRRIITPYFGYTVPDEVILSCPEIPWPENIGVDYKYKNLKDEKEQQKNSSKKRSRLKKTAVVTESEVIKVPEDQKTLLTNEVLLENIANSPPNDEDNLFDSFDFPCIDISMTLNKPRQKTKSEIVTPTFNSKPFRHKPFRVLNSFKDEPDKVIEPESPPKPKSQFKGWAILTPPNSVESCEKNVLSSPPKESSFVEIIASEQQARHDLFKMKGKSFALTQMEDKAMEELHEFYNAANVFDEKITVHRVTSLHAPKPTWVKTNKTLFH